jgi:hypothetical protein
MFELRLIEVEGYAQAIPIVTGMKPGTMTGRVMDDYTIMILCLELLGGSAPRHQWLPQVQQFTEQRGDRWSDDTFDRRRKEMQDNGWIVGGGGQNVPYEFANTEEAWQARDQASGYKRRRPAQTGAPGCTEPGAEQASAEPENPSANHPPAAPLKGGAVPAGGFSGPATTRKAPANQFAGGSRNGGDGLKSVAGNGVDLAGEAIQQLKQPKG